MTIPEPQYTIIMFGDGCQARAVKEIPNIIEDDGSEVTEFWLVPSEPMIDYHEINDQDWHGEVIRRRYLSTDIIPLNTDPAINTKLIIKDFEFRDTILSRKYPKTSYINELRKQIEIQKKIIARQNQQLKLLGTRQREFMDRYSDLVQSAAKARQHVRSDEEIEQQGGEY